MAKVNFFSSEDYLSCVAEAYFPDRQYDLVDYRVERSTYRLLSIRRSGLKPEKTVTWVPFLDMLEPIDGEGKPGPTYLPFASLEGKLTVGQWKAREEKGAQSAGSGSGTVRVSPLVDFTMFPNWDAFVDYARARPGQAFPARRPKQLKKLDMDHGVTLTWNDDAPDALHQLMRWKSQQYVESGYMDAFRARALERLFVLLRERKRLIVTTMRLKGALVAGHAGMEHDGRFYYWLPAYDKQWGKQSVGVILQEWLMEEAHRRAAKEFDFLLGNENYKWSYATHTRLVGPVGKKPLSQRLWEPVRARAMEEVRRHPEVHKSLQELKRKVSSWQMRCRG